MPLVNLKLGDKHNYSPVEHLFENYAAIVSGSSFEKHACLFFSGKPGEMQCHIVDAANKNEVIEEFTHDKIKAATIVATGETFVSATYAALGTTKNPSGFVPCPVIKYLVVFKDGRQAILTTRLADSQHLIESIIF